MPSRGYPRTAAECLRDGMKFRRGVVAAVKAFRRVGPWRGALEGRKRKFRRLNDALARAYGMPAPELRFERIDGSFSGASSCRRRGDGRPAVITMRGKLSVVTFLHEFAHALGRDERGACRWSINLFRRVFPEQYTRLQADGHTLRRTQERRR
jgi:hypothetical protein